MNMKKILLFIMLFSIIAFSGCLEENNEISKEDFEINAEWNNNDFVPHFHTDSDSNPLIDSNSIHDEFVLNVESNREGYVYFKVYDKSKDLELTKLHDDSTNEYNQQITRTHNIYKSRDHGDTVENFSTQSLNLFTISLNSFEEQKEIDVYFSLNDNFDIKDEGVVKLSTILPKRNVDFEVNPSTIKFTFSKSLPATLDSKQITITNTGDIMLSVGVYLPYSTFYEPRYRGEGYGVLLKPGESKQYKLISTIFDTPIDTYQTDLTIGALFNDSEEYMYFQNKDLTDAHYVKTISLETTVTA